MKHSCPVLPRLLLLGLCLVFLAGCPVSKKRRLFFATCGVAADCVSNLCVSGVCSKSCTTSVECGEGVCVQQACLPVERVQCADDAYCQELLAGRPCVRASCDAGKCAAAPLAEGTACNAADDAACQAATCSAGQCVATSGDKNCNDGLACTADSCVAKVGCVFAPDNSLCPADKPCSTPICDTKTGCSTVAITGSCDDGNPCTSDDSCATGSCIGTPRGPYQVQLGSELLRPRALAVQGDSVLVLSDAPTGANLLRLQFVSAATGAVTATKTFGDAKSQAIDVAALSGTSAAALAVYVDAGGPKVALVTPDSVQQVGLGNLTAVTRVAVLDQTVFVLGTLASGDAAVQRLQLPGLTALGTTPVALAQPAAVSALWPLTPTDVLIGGQHTPAVGTAVAMVARASLQGAGSLNWTADLTLAGAVSPQVSDLAADSAQWLAAVSDAAAPAAQLQLGLFDGSTTVSSGLPAGRFAIARSQSGWAAAGGATAQALAWGNHLSQRGAQLLLAAGKSLRAVDVAGLASSPGSWTLATTAASASEAGEVWLVRATDHAISDCTLGNCTALAACTDGNDCSRDTCDPASGCAFVPEALGTACEDGDACSANDSCGTDSACSGDLMRWSRGGDQATAATAVVAADGQIYALVEEVSGLGPTVGLHSLSASGQDLWQKMVQVTGDGTGWALAADGSYVYVAWRDGGEADGIARLGIWSDSGEAGPSVSAGAGNRVLGLAISNDSLWSVGDGPGAAGAKAQIVRRKTTDLTPEVTVSAGLGVSVEETLWSGAVAPDGTLVAVGSVRKTAAAQADGWIVQVSPAGAVVKTTQLSHPQGADVLYALTPMALSGGQPGFVAAGERVTATGKRVWVVRLTAHGEVLWDKAIEPGLSGATVSSARSIVALHGSEGLGSGSLIVLGQLDDKAAFAQALDPYGNPMAAKEYGIGQWFGGVGWSGDRWIAVGRTGPNGQPLQGSWRLQMADIWLQESCDELDCLGTSPAECDDGNPCTTNFCAADKCVTVPLPAGFACGDGDGCQTGPLCGSSGGVSKCGTPGTKTCTDNNPCTADSCDTTDGCVHTPVADGNPCAGGQCVAGQCQ